MQNAGAAHFSDIVVAVQPQGEGVPLFLVAPGTEALGLARMLGRKRPVYGIRVPNLEHSPHLASIHDMAEVCSRAIRKARPEGPYAVAGWCAAAVLALEIAQHLERCGEQIAFVAMLDARTVFLPPMSRLKRLVVRAWHQCQRLRFFLGRVVAEGPPRLWSAGRGRLIHARETRGRAIRGLPRSHADALAALVATHRPSQWDGAMVHIWASERPRGRFRGPEFVCTHLSPGGFSFYEVPGDHLSMFSEPNLEVLAHIFATELDRAGVARHRVAEPRAIGL